MIDKDKRLRWGKMFTKSKAFLPSPSSALLSLSKPFSAKYTRLNNNVIDLYLKQRQFILITSRRLKLPLQPIWREVQALCRPTNKKKVTSHHLRFNISNVCRMPVGGWRIETASLQSDEQGDKPSESASPVKQNVHFLAKEECSTTILTTNVTLTSLMILPALPMISKSSRPSSRRER